MRTVYTIAASALLATSVAAQSGLTINTPTGLITCVPNRLQWSGGLPPYNLGVNVGGSTSNLIKTLVTSTNDTSYTWRPDLSPQSITLAITDASGAKAYSAPADITAGSTTNCPASSSSGSSSAGGSSTSSSSASSTTSTTSSTTSTTTSTTSTTTSSTSSSSPPVIIPTPSPTTTRTSGAAAPVANLAGAGTFFVAAVAAALL